MVLDINKFLWMVRIGGSTPEGAHIKEQDYYTKNGEYRMDREGSPTMLNSLMYKLCYYKFGGHYFLDLLKSLCIFPIGLNVEISLHETLNRSSDPVGSSLSFL